MKDPLFRLVLRSGEIAPTACTLWSTKLDPLMHAGHRGVGVMFSSNCDDERHGSAVLTDFHINSIGEYLTSQALVRRELETALDKHRKAWHLHFLRPGRAVWRQVRIACILFETPDHDRSGTIELLRRMMRGTRGRSLKLLKKQLNSELKLVKTKVRSQFSVVLERRDKQLMETIWSDHQRIGVFRNGAFSDLIIEG